MFNLVQLNAPDPEREGHNHMRVRRPARGALFDLFFERGLEIEDPGTWSLEGRNRGNHCLESLALQAVTANAAVFFV